MTMVYVFYDEAVDYAAAVDNGDDNGDNYMMMIN